MNRFDYVKYDIISIKDQDDFKRKFKEIELMISVMTSERPKEIALSKLEECYMWVGKVIRDDQIARNETAEPQEERKDG